MHWIRKSLQPHTISERYADVGGFTHGFDYIRLILAAAVLVVHSFPSSYGPWTDAVVWRAELRMVVAPILLMFFALSGFLVTGSLKRQPTATAFITLRVLRLMPALAVEVLLSAVLLGAALTSLSLSEYFRHPDFFAYFGNMIGRIRFFLPGVFSENPVGIVNVSLWTVPYELECYLALLVLWMTGALKHRWITIAVTALLISAATCWTLTHFNEAFTNAGNRPRSLITAFLAGACISLYADFIRLDWRIAVLALIGLMASTLVYQTVYIASIFAAYLVIYAGMSHPPKKTFLLKGDYSYGLYLFAAPLQQTYTHLFPDHRTWYFNSMAALGFGLLYAAFSWWVIEKPILNRKKHFVSAAESIVLKIKNFLVFRPA